MNRLHRELAPLSTEAWEEVEEEATRVLKLTLAGRKLVDFDGPRGWGIAALATGRTSAAKKGPHEGVNASIREVAPLVEFRTPFEIARQEVDAIDRGAKDADVDAVTKAAFSAAMAEDRAVFHGYGPAGITGMCEAAADRAVTLSSDYEQYPRAVTEALHRLHLDGVEGPYGLALGPRCHAGLLQTVYKGGFPVLMHVKQLLDGPIIKAQAVDGAVLLSLRGGDFELTVGGDLSIGYLGHDDSKVRLYLEESFTFRVLGPEAAVPLVYGK